MGAISTVFAEVWSKEVKMAYQQRAPRFPERIRVETGVQGDTWKFNKLDATVGVQTSVPTAGIDGSATPVSHSSVTATLTPSFVWLYLNAEEMKLTSVSEGFRRSYVQNAAWRISRAVDAKVVAAMDASFSSIPTTTGALSYAKILEAMEVLNSKDVPEEDWTLFLAARQVRDLRGITEFTSRDFINQPINSRIAGRIDTVFGNVNVVLSNQLSASASIRSCYLVHKEAVGMAQATPVTTTLTWIEEKDQWLAKSKENSGAVTIDLEGVVQLRCDES
jgi:hypothetical protein